MALLWGVLSVLMLAVVQTAVLYYCGQLVLTAAQDGLRSGRGYLAETVTDSARRDAEDFLARAGGSLLTDVTVTAGVDGAGLLRVRVTARAPSLVPGLPVDIVREAVGGLERITP